MVWTIRANERNAGKHYHEGRKREVTSRGTPTGRMMDNTRAESVWYAEGVVKHI